MAWPPLACGPHTFKHTPGQLIHTAPSPRPASRRGSAPIFPHRKHILDLTSSYCLLVLTSHSPLISVVSVPSTPQNRLLPSSGAPGLLFTHLALPGLVRHTAVPPVLEGGAAFILFRDPAAIVTRSYFTVLPILCSQIHLPSRFCQPCPTSAEAKHTYANGHSWSQAAGSCKLPGTVNPKSGEGLQKMVI